MSNQTPYEPKHLERDICGSRKPGPNSRDLYQVIFRTQINGEIRDYCRETPIVTRLFNGDPNNRDEVLRWADQMVNDYPHLCGYVLDCF